MKSKLILLLIMMALCPAMLHAQDGVSRLRLKAGIKAGLNFSQLKGDSWESGYKTNLLGGVYLGVQGPKLGVQAEGLFTQSTYVTGTDFKQIGLNHFNNIADSARQGSFRVNSLSIPLLLNLKLFNNAVIQLGPQYTGIVSVDDKDALLKDAASLFSKGDLSGVAGLWIELPMHLNIGARYIFGLTDVNNSDQLQESWKRKVVQVHLGYTF
jgi:hypothetical protein